MPISQLIFYLKSTVMLKKVLIGVVAVVALLLLIPAFLPKTYTVERSVTIAKPKAEVFEYIKHVQNQNIWGPWIKQDPGVKLDTRGTDGTVGFVSIWDSANGNLGAGEQEIKKIVEGERYDVELRFKRPMEDVAQGYMTTTGDSTQTKVTWGIHGNMPYPMNIMQLFIDMDKMLGKDFEDGLSNLKTILEKK
jgi:hypothetical protein